MKSKIFTIRIVSCSLVVAILISSCERKSDPKNQITIIINSVDGNTKENRVNMFDTIEVRIERFGFPKKKYVKVAEYTTDFAGSVSVKLDRNEAYLFMLGGKRKFFGSERFSTEDRKDGKKVNIKVISLDDR
jgi:hypothetical protein